MKKNSRETVIMLGLYQRGTFKAATIDLPEYQIYLSHVSVLNKSVSFQKRRIL